MDKRLKKIKEELEDAAEFDEDSDITVHEKYTKEKKFKRT